MVATITPRKGVAIYLKKEAEDEKIGCPDIDPS
jgi:hypothetical protein